MLMSLIHFESGAFIEEDFFSFSCVLDSFVEDQLAIDAWVYVCIFYPDPLVFLSVFVAIPFCFYCYGSVVYFEVEYVVPPALNILLRIVLAT
jgi:hypothetical protein